MKRRVFLQHLIALTAGFAGAKLLAQANPAPVEGPFRLAPLPFSPDALEPHFDTLTMQIHHGKHHAAYVNRLNETLVKVPELAGLPLDDLCRQLPSMPIDPKVRATLINNAGGHWNHDFFWGLLNPESRASAPSGEFAEALNAEFGSLEGFQKAFVAAALGRFGSGWAWLCRGSDGRLKITDTANQVNPLMEDGSTALIGLDVWEHAYYLKYQNRRADYIAAFWKILNWRVAEAHFHSVGLR